MRHVTDRPGLTANQIASPGSVEHLVDLLLLHRQAQLLVLLDGYDHRYHLAAMTDYLMGVTGGQFAYEVMVTKWTDSMTSQHSGVPRSEWRRRLDSR
jgi:hypothetical protein